MSNNLIIELESFNVERKQYRAQDTPFYRLGHAVVLGYIGIGLASSAICTVMLRWENARRDRGERDEVIRGVINSNARERNGVYDSVDEARGAKGDKWSGFRYIV